jgi:hypothetical protein
VPSLIRMYAGDSGLCTLIQLAPPDRRSSFCSVPNRFIAGARSRGGEYCQQLYYSLVGRSSVA